MVGVPGRSKACETCRQRRIAVRPLSHKAVPFQTKYIGIDQCGLQRPQCEQCVRANRVCGGYQRDRIFVVGAGNTYRADKKKNRSNSSMKPYHRDEDKLKAEVVLESKSPYSDLPIQQVIMPASAFGCDLIPYPAYRQQLLNLFVCGYCPVTRLGPNVQRSWICSLPELNTFTKALEMSTMAICTARFGRDTGNLWLVKESLRLYTQGLQQLQMALWDPELMYRDETLGACMALALYEVMECPSESRHAYVSHQQGCARLVQLRGAEAHASGLGHQIFLSFRVQGVLEALKHHRTTYLADREWTEKPWSKQTKSPFDRVFDYFVAAPELFRRGDRLGQLDLWSSLRETLFIIERCLEVDAGLEDLLEELTATSDGPLYWPELSQISNEADGSKEGKVFPVAFHFCDLRTANTFMYYWSTILMLWSGLCQLYRHLSDLKNRGIDLEQLDESDVPSLSDQKPLLKKNLESRKVPPLGHRTDFASIAWNICQSVEYCIQDEMLDFGPQSVAVPLQIVIETMKVDPRYFRHVQWAQEVISIIGRKGMKILKYASE